MSGKRVVVRDVLLYKPNVSVEDIKNFIIHITKPELPFLGIFDFSWFLSLTPRLIIKRVGNTLSMYMKMNKRLSHISHFVFPFRFGKIREIEEEHLSIFPLPGFAIAVGSFIEFMLKGNFVEIGIRVLRIFGKNIGFGSAVRADGKRVFFISFSPETFLSFDLDKHPSIYMELLEPMPKAMSFKSETPIFQEEDTSLGVTNFDPIQHTLVVGESGSGKSMFLMIFIKALLKHFKDQLSVVILDPHGEFSRRFTGDKHVVDFKTEYVDPLTIEGEYSPMFAQLITQLIMGSIGEENKYAERVVFHSVHLLGSIGELNLKNLHDLLADEVKRMEFVTKCDVDEVKNFFDVEFPDIYIHHFNDAILPIINFISEYTLYLGSDKKKITLMELLSENKPIIISFDPNFFGKKMIHFFGASIINQMYILAITGKLEKKTMLVIDEVSRVETKILKDILAETRKFNLFLLIATQYLGQLQKDVLNAIIGNVRNIIAFKLHKKDAELLSGMMDIRIEEFFKKHMSTTELEEKKKEMFVRLDTREAIVRLFDGKKYYPPMKVKTVDVKRWLEESNNK